MKIGRVFISILIVALLCCFVPSASADMSGNGWYLENDVLHITANLGDYRVASSRADTITTSPFEVAGIQKQVHKIVVEEGVTIIGGLTFFDLVNMTEIDLPSSLLEIHGEAFYGCSSLAAITIPENVSVIGPNAFYSCSNLKTVTFEGNAPEVSGYSYWFDFYSSSPPFKTFGDAFYRSDRVWTAEKMAALGSNMLTWHDLNVINSGTCGENAFWSYSTNNVLTITGSGELEAYRSGNETPWSAYNSEIIEVVVKEGITKIPSYTFEYMSHMQSVRLPDTLSILECNAFNNCSNLESVTIPASLTSFGQNVYFNRCNLLSDIFYVGSESEWQQIENYQDCRRYDGDVSYHFLVINEGRPSTCTETGIGSYYTFDDPNNTAIYSLDKKLLTSLPVLPLQNHDLTKNDGLPASCTEEGIDPYWTCSVCGQMFADDKAEEQITEPVVAPATGHFLHIHTVENSDPVWACTNCGQKYADEEGQVEIIHDGVCGNNVIWLLDEEGVLTLAGSGAIPNFTGVNSTQEWRQYRDLINTAVICKEITQIGDYAFYNCNSLTSINYNGTEEQWGDIYFGIHNEVLEQATLHCLHSISIVPDGIGDVTATVNDTVTSNAPEDVLVTLKIAPAEDYELQSVTENDVVLTDVDGVYSFVMPNENVVIRPVFKKTVFVVNVGDCINGSVTVDGNKFYAGSIVKLSIVPDEGYELNTILALHQETVVPVTDYSFTMPEGDVEVLCTFKPIQYTITWLNDDGSLIETATVEYGQFPDHADAIKENTDEYTYTFTGWTPEIVPAKENVTYTANYTATRNSYTITWLNDDGGLIDTTIVEYGQLPSHSDPSKENTAEFIYTFAGWTPEIDNVTGDATYQAVFDEERIEHVVSFDANGGHTAPEAQVKYGGTDLVLTTEEPVRDFQIESYYVRLNANGGSVSPSLLTASKMITYSFRGWNTSPDGSGTYFEPGGSYTYEEDVVLYAQWGSSAELAAVTLPTPSREGHDFLGWADDADAAGGITGYFTTESNVTLYAIWKKQEFTVAYEANGGTAVPESQVKTYGEDLILSDSVPVKDGCVFLGWSLNPDATTADYLPGDSFSLNADTILYAVWLEPDFTLPASLTTIGEEAFSGSAAIYVKLPETAKEIQNRAFADCPNLRYIYIPATTTSIHRNAFENVSELTVLGEEGSYAAYYASIHHFDFIAIPS